MKPCDDIKALEKRIEHFKKYIEDIEKIESLMGAIFLVCAVISLVLMLALSIAIKWG